MREPECKGQGQVVEQGAELVFEAVFRDEHGQPKIELPVKFVLVKGDGILEQSDAVTSHSGDVCAILTPDGKTRRGRVELQYGQKLEHMVPFLYVVESSQEEEATPLHIPPEPMKEEVTAPPFSPAIAEASIIARAQGDGATDEAVLVQTAPPVAIPVVSRPAPAAPRTVKPAPTRVQGKTAAKQVKRKATSLTAVSPSQLAVLGAVIVAYGLLTLGLINRLMPRVEPSIDLIVDCSKAPPARRVGNTFVRDCPLYRK